MSNSYLYPAALAALFLSIGACGSTPSPRQETGQVVTPETETTATAVEVQTVPAAETARPMTSTSKPLPVQVRETLPGTIRKTFPLAASARPGTSPFPHRVVRDSTGRVLGYEVFSDSAGVTAQGYAGKVPVQVLFDAQGKPVRIYVLENCETAAYMEIVCGSGLLERLLALDPAKPDSVDAVTLATSSSRAVIAGVTGLAARVRAELVATRGGLR